MLLSTMPMLAVSCSRKCQVGGGESAQRGQFDHRLDAILKEHWQHDDVARYGFEQAGADRDGVLRQVA